jgi:alanine racemase
MVRVIERTRARFRPTVAVVDLDAIRHNVRLLRRDGAAFMAVVKANGYGHGAIPVASAALDAGAAWFGVALVEEGVALREAGLDAPILVLAEFPPGSEEDALAARLTPTVYTAQAVRRLSAAATAVGDVRPGVHVKVDTGMHRVGAHPADVPALCRAMLEAGLRVEGLWTHLAKSEELDDPFTTLQLGRFGAVVNVLASAGVRVPTLHAANSAAAIARPETRFDVVRVGIAMYGVAPGGGVADVPGLRPAMSWRSAVSFVKRVTAGERLSYGLRYRLDRDATVATVPVGYADGYSRLLSNRADVLIRGRPHRVAGAVTMDQILVDCGDEQVESGDEVVLIGRQGDQSILASELSELMGTIPYEVVCGVSERVPREYVEDRRG